MPIKHLRQLKQSIWTDHLSRDYLESGGLEKHIKQGVSGITSNPSILCQAIANSDLYDREILELVRKDKDSLDIYEELIRRDVCVAASLLHFVYASTNKLDGYVSIEVDPAFAHRVDATVYQGAHLFNLIDCPNIMIKVPGTNAGIEAFKRLIFEGINVNVTLLFSVDQYEKVALAYLEAMEARKADGRRLDNVTSVASFFISRIDVAVNNVLKSLESIDTKQRDDFWGKAAIASAKLAYEKWYEIFHGNRFVRLRNAGARPQRLLWASTSNKYRAEPPLKYVTNLIAPETVNTLPLKTLDSIMECKDPLTDTLVRYSSWDAGEYIDDLKNIVNVDIVTAKLLDDGIKLFADSFDELMSCLYYRVLSERGEICQRKF